jgi:hypothetical protein
MATAIAWEFPMPEKPKFPKAAPISRSDIDSDPPPEELTETERSIRLCNQVSFMYQEWPGLKAVVLRLDGDMVVLRRDVRKLEGRVDAVADEMEAIRSQREAVSSELGVGARSPTGSHFILTEEQVTKLVEKKAAEKVLQDDASAWRWLRSKSGVIAVAMVTFLVLSALGYVIVGLTLAHGQTAPHLAPTHDMEH